MELILEFCKETYFEVLELKDGTFVVVDNMDKDRIVLRGTEIDIAKYIMETILEFDERSEMDNRVFKGLKKQYFNN